jgi:adenine-specific DNA methylase
MKRLIEVEGAFPLAEVSRESRREKNIRHGHISTLHIWWARRPLAASRTTIFAALIPADNLSPKALEPMKELIAQMAPWEVVKDGDKHVIRQARAILQKIYPQPSKVLDCFAGGGSIPLEALRLGCETYALEYNPVAVLILKATLEYPQKFGRRLLEEVKRWGDWVLNEARKELASFYPTDPDDSIPVGYIWARTLPCQDPNCGAEIPLMRQTWLANTDRRKIALKLLPDKENKQVDAVIVEGSQIDFDPSIGTVKGAIVTCPICGGVIDDDTTRQLFREGKAGQRMMAVVLHYPSHSGKRYRLPTERDLKAYHSATEALKQKVERLRDEWRMEPVPDEPTPTGGGPGAERAFSVHKYGMTTWGDLFNERQKLALLTFAEKVRQAYTEMLNEGADSEFAKAVATYLAFVISKTADYCSVLCQWRNNLETVGHTFARQALPMLWDYVEGNPVTGASGTAEGGLEWVISVLAHLSQIPPASTLPQVHQGSATELPYPDKFFDAVITDPPYYDNVPYSDLSDFFYVWLRRTIGHLYPDLFLTPLTPKVEELVADTQRRGGSMEAAKQWFEQQLTQAFREIYRVLKDDGIAVIVFAHTSVEAWESIINALLNADLYLTASLPIHTEMEVRLRQQNSAALASSVYMVCRKRVEEKIGEYRLVIREMEEKIPQSLERFWDAGISGPDFWQSAIGPAVAIFGRYKKVVKQDGTEVSVKALLEEARRITAHYALRRVLEEVGGDEQTVRALDPVTRFYLVWRWTFGGGKIRVPFNDALLVARSEGVELRDLARADSIVCISSGMVKVVGPTERKGDKRFLETLKFDSLIDALHRAVIAWQSGDETTLQAMLSLRGNDETFWQVAQAIAEVLPEGDEERRLLFGLLQKRGRVPQTTQAQAQLDLA